MKFIPPGDPADKPAGRFSKAQMQREMARQAAMEKEMARYMQIECGHYTDLETQHRYAVWRPKRGQVFCEKCDNWLKVKPPNRYHISSDTPLF